MEAGTIFTSMHLCVLQVYIMVVNFFQLRLFIQDKIPWPNWCFLYSFGDQDSTVVTVLAMGWAFEVCFSAGVGVTLLRPAYVHTQPPLYLILGSLPRVLWLGIELFFCFHLVETFPPFLMNDTRSCTSIPPHVFTAWCFILDYVSFIFTSPNSFLVCFFLSPTHSIHSFWVAIARQNKSHIEWECDLCKCCITWKSYL
jgi:hypothetical protein